MHDIGWQEDFALSLIQLHWLPIAGWQTGIGSLATSSI